MVLCLFFTNLIPEGLTPPVTIMLNQLWLELNMVRIVQYTYCAAGINWCIEIETKWPPFSDDIFKSIASSCVTIVVLSPVVWLKFHPSLFLRPRDQIKISHYYFSQWLGSKQALKKEKSHHWGPFYYHWLTFIPAWISNCTRYKVRDEITYSFSNFNGCTVEVSESLQWRHNGRDGVSNHQPHHFLLNCLFKAQIKEKIKAPRHWPLCHRWPVNSPHKWPVTRERFPFDDAIVMDK